MAIATTLPFFAYPKNSRCRRNDLLCAFNDFGDFGERARRPGDLLDLQRLVTRSRVLPLGHFDFNDFVGIFALYLCFCLYYYCIY
jgi:hypothetical protein